MGAIGRAFLAVVPPDEVLDALVERMHAGRRLEPDLRWVRREQLHVTLQFLGRVDDTDALVDALRAAAASVPAFEAQLGGAGAYPKPSRASVVWAGVAVGEDRVSGLATALRGATAALGFESEERRFHPHVTLARRRKPKTVAALLDAWGHDPIGPAFTVAEIVLHESSTTPQGARYRLVERLPLA